LQGRSHDKAGYFDGRTSGGDPGGIQEYDPEAELEGEDRLPAPQDREEAVCAECRVQQVDERLNG